MMAPLFERLGLVCGCRSGGGSTGAPRTARDDARAGAVVGAGDHRAGSGPAPRWLLSSDQGRCLGRRPPLGPGSATPGRTRTRPAPLGAAAHGWNPIPNGAGRGLDAQPAAGRARRRRIARALNDAGVVPIGGRPGPQPAPDGGRMDAADVAAILATALHGRRCGTGNRPRRTWSTRPTPRSAQAGAAGEPDEGWVISSTRRTRRWSARPTPSRPRTPPRRRAPQARPCGGPAGRAAGLRAVRAAVRIGIVTAGPPAGAAAVAARRPDPHGRRTSLLREDRILPHLAALPSSSPADAGTRTPAGIAARPRQRGPDRPVPRHGHHLT